jgi:hypothetical protein
VDQLKNKRDAEKLAQIRAHLAAIQAAKEQAVTEGNLPEGQMLSRQDIEPFMAAWPVPVAGETYEIGVVGETPYAVAPVAIAEYPAGTRIEP